MMKRKLQIFLAALLALPALGAGLSHTAYASGGQVADCTFQTLQAELSLGGDWYYAPGQCASAITFPWPIWINSSASLTAQGNNISFAGNSAVHLFDVPAGATLRLKGVTVVSGGLPLLYETGVFGGAFRNDGNLSIANSTLSGNAAQFGGAIYNAGSVSITNSTLSNNIAYAYLADSGGGAIYNTGTVSIANSTISSNNATWHGAIDNHGTVTVFGSIVAGNTGGNCYNDGGTIQGQGYNLEDGTDCGFTGSGSRQNTDPKLGPLADNGGHIQTMALQQGSPAIDAIPTSTHLCPGTDERGAIRPDDRETRCDMGAYESEYRVATSTSLASSTNPSVSGQTVTYTATVSPGVDGGTVSFSDDGQVISGCQLQSVSTDTGEATCSTIYRNVGTHSITATYAGDSTFAPSTSPVLSQVVKQATTTTTLSSVPNPSTYGQAVTFTARISVNAPGAGNPHGTVTFQANGQTISGCSSQSVDTYTETATCTTSSLPASPPYGEVARATYNGDADFIGSYGSETQVVNKAQASLALSNLTQTYDGSPKPVTVTTTPSGLSGVTITYTGSGSTSYGPSTAAPIVVGTYSVDASLTNPNYTAPDATGTLTINP